MFDFAAMSLTGVQESIKNFCVIQEESPLPAPGSEKVVVEMGKRLDDEWNMRVSPPLSMYQVRFESPSLTCFHEIHYFLQQKSPFCTNFR